MTKMKINYNLSEFKSQVNAKTKPIFDKLSVKKNKAHWAGVVEQVAIKIMRKYIIEAVQYAYNIIGKMKRRDIEDWYQKSLDAGYWSLEHGDAPKFWKTGLVKTGRFMKNVMNESLIMIRDSVNKSINKDIIKAVIDMGKIEQSTTDPLNPKSGAYIIRMREHVADYMDAYENTLTTLWTSGAIHTLVLDILRKNMGVPFSLQKQVSIKMPFVYKPTTPAPPSKTLFTVQMWRTSVNYQRLKNEARKRLQSYRR